MDFGSYKLTRKNAGFFIAGIDIVSMLTLLIGLLVIGSAQNRNEKYFKEQIVNITHYTIHFKNLQLNGITVYEEIDLLIKHINSTFKTELKGKLNDNFFIYDINYPVLTDTKLDLIINKNKLNEQRKHLEIIEKNRNVSSQKLLKIQQKVNVLKTKIDQVDTKIKAAHNTGLSKVNDIYVTFTNQEYAQAFSQFYNRSKCSRCCLIFWCQRNKIKHL